MEIMAGQTAESETDASSNVQSLVPLDITEDWRSCGQKALNLGRLVRAGFPVPEGVVVTSDVFRNYHDGEFPPRLLDAIGDFSCRIGTDHLLAIRSSAVGEDSSHAAFAGQLDSILHVRPDRPELLQAIIDCWASYQSPRTDGYQRAQGVRMQGMGVIVQRMVQARFSGVMFTRHPVANSQPESGDTMVIEYCCGTCEQLVAGMLTPMRITADRITGDWTLESTGKDNPHQTPCLPDDVIRMLVRTANEIEQLFDSPQDIEWCLDDSWSLFILQSRPITTLDHRDTSGNASLVGGDDSVIWSNANMVENYPEPVVPMLESIAVSAYYHYFLNLGVALGVSGQRIQSVKKQLCGVVGVQAGRLYYNLTNIHTVLRATPFGELLVGSFNQYLGTAQTISSGVPESWIRRLGTKIFSSLQAVWITIRACWYFSRLGQLTREFEEVAIQFSSRVEGELKRPSTCGLLECFRGFQEVRNHRWLNASLVDASTMLSSSLLKWYLRRVFGPSNCDQLHVSLLTGLSDLASGEPARRLWDLSREIRSDTELTKLFRTDSSDVILDRLNEPVFAHFHQQFGRFRREWGFRSSRELMLVYPSYDECPETLIELLKTYVSLGDDESDLDAMTDLRERAEQQVGTRKTAWKKATAEISRSSLLPIWPYSFRYVAFQCLYRWSIHSITCRERVRLQQSLLYCRLRQILLAIGEVLVSRKLLAIPEDVFYLMAGECESRLEDDSPVSQSVRSIIDARRRAQAAWVSVEPAETLRLPAGIDWRPTEENSRQKVANTGSSEKVLRGAGASQGLSTGRAIVLTDVSQIDQITPGDILITKQTDPGWGPVFVLVRGLVVERGGLLSHSAILAREFGIPTVVGVADATRQIRSGDHITVDGDRGLVLLS